MALVSPDQVSHFCRFERAAETARSLYYVANGIDLVYNAFMLINADSALAPFPDKTPHSQLLRRAVGVDISMQYLDEQAKVRTGIGSPSKQFDGLPMFD